MKKIFLPIILILIFTTTTQAEETNPATPVSKDWNTYRGNQKRQCISQEKILLPLQLKWNFKSGFAPAPAWGDGFALKNPAQKIPLISAVDFDRSLYPIIGNGRFIMLQQQQIN